MVTLTSLSASADSLTPAHAVGIGILDAPPLDLELPEPTIDEQAKTYTFNTEGYEIILKIFTGYTLWADNYVAESESDSLYELRLETCHDRKDELRHSLDICLDDRKHAYTLFRDERNDQGKAKVKSFFKTLAVGVGAGVVGIAIGIVTGIIIAKK
jgi:hypothetical protein